jgi:hypothetical protein
VLNRDGGRVPVEVSSIPLVHASTSWASSARSRTSRRSRSRILSST